MTEVGCALIGAGRIGRVHADAIAATGDARLVAVADPRAEAAAALAERHGARVASVDEIAKAGDVEAVAICASTDSHATLIERFAPSGKAIFCEKPIDLDLARARACVEAVGRAGARLMIGFNRRFDPHFAALLETVASGRVGEVEMVQITSRDPAAPPLDYVETSGGVFRDMTIHDFDMGRALLGEEPVEVFATGSTLTDPRIADMGDYDSVSVVMVTASGRHCAISNSRRAAYGYDQRAEVHGSRGVARLDNPRVATVSWGGEEGFAEGPLHDFFMTRYAAAYANEMAAFVEAVMSGGPMSPGGGDGLMALALAEAAQRSAGERRVVALSEVLA